VWSAGYGAVATTDCDAVLGSHTASSRVYGGVLGLDYRIGPNTLAGIALAGGETNFNVQNGLGSGRSDLFQAGAFAKHHVGNAYVLGALAYGWQDVTTDRTLGILRIDQFRARFNTNAWSGRVEAGYRFVAPVTGAGVTPYAAGAFTSFDLPSYAEEVRLGAGTFALGYDGRRVTDTKSELGVRTDKSFLPGAAFTVFGAAPARSHRGRPR
jgi:outer membrane autotransporter protein